MNDFEIVEVVFDLLRKFIQAFEESQHGFIRRGSSGWVAPPASQSDTALVNKYASTEQVRRGGHFVNVAAS